MRARQASLNPSNEGSDACYDQYPNKTLTLNLDDGWDPLSRAIWSFSHLPSRAITPIGIDIHSPSTPYSSQLSISFSNLRWSSCRQIIEVKKKWWAWSSDIDIWSLSWAPKSGFLPKAKVRARPRSVLPFFPGYLFSSRIIIPFCHTIFIIHSTWKIV